MSEADSPARDYRDTVFLPKTDFPMKAGLPQKEPAIAAKWEAEKLYEQLRDTRRGRPRFMYHDGPPYANGDMHIGHALNHTIKDMVCRTQNLLGKDAPYVPGWDCHGLPIEWKVEEAYRKAKRDKPVPSVAEGDAALLEFRAECRAYAQHWVSVQRAQLKRLGVMADWDNPYLTMQPESEAIIVEELLKLAGSGQLYRGAKPVMWSPVEQTALAEAEVEYEDVVSTQIDVAFEIVESPIPELVGAHAVIWTTTPWTIPVNQALAYGPEVEYSLIQLASTGVLGWGSQAEAADSNPAHRFFGRKMLIATPLLKFFEQRLGSALTIELTKDFPDSDVIVTFHEHARFVGSKLQGTLAQHPMHHLGGFFATPRPFLAGEFVTTDSGTGLVHMAPDHGEDDFELCKQYEIGPVFAVEADGRYRDDWLWLGGQGSVINDKFNGPEGPILIDLREVGALVAGSTYVHAYPHSYPKSWRSKAKVIFRCTPQWFVPMDKELPSRLREGSGVGASSDGGAETCPPLTPPASGRGTTLRRIALAEIERVRFIPEKGRNRIGSMVAGRPDWVLSRQRAWGVPITLFVNRTTGEYLVDEAVNSRIVEAVRAQGIDAWTPETAHRFLGGDYDASEWEPVADILDVWFDSGTSHAYVLESGRWPDLSWPADIYVEGSDQHRGWFQSSLLHSCATRGRAPYDQILTHGFTMDAKGLKMSKSLGNTVDPIKVMETYGADIIRLWALSVDFTEDHRIGDEILKGIADQYRKLRNTFRYLLGALDGFDEAERLGPDGMPELERYVLALLGEVDATLRRAVEAYDFNTYVRTLIEFCNEDLSAFYFDIRKDSLYCDAPGDPRRRAYRSVLDTLFHALVRWAAPVIVFTAEEVWAARYPDGGSVHLLEWPEVPANHPIHRQSGLDPSQGSSSGLAENGLAPGQARGDEYFGRWRELRALRDRVNEAIEPLRRDKIVRSGLEAEVTVPAGLVPGGFTDADLAELFITATVRRGDGDAVTVTRTPSAKCGRCWRLLPEVPEEGALCGRCAQVIA